MQIIRARTKTAAPAEALVALARAWDVLGTDAVSICAGTLEVLRAYLGERPCCAWRSHPTGLIKVSERGLVEMFLSDASGTHQAALARAAASGVAEFDPCDLGAVEVERAMSLDGFLHIPIKGRDQVAGLLTIAVRRKEAKDVDFVHTLEALGRMVGVAMQHAEERDALVSNERKLRSEVTATTHELEATNVRLIARVKELKALFAELEARVAELRLANQSKDEFLSIVSHELRTPLTSLIGFLVVVLDGDAGAITAEQRRCLEIAHVSADRLAGMISDLLDISRLEADRLELTPAACPVEPLIGAAVAAQAAAVAVKSLDVRCELVRPLPAVWADGARLKQAIGHLLSNAVKFTEPGGVIVLRAEDQGDAVRVSVSDSGPGLAPDEQDKIFDHFYQADSSNRRAAGGAGLGLSIARGIIRMHGGRLWVESEKGHGATFRFVIPIHRDKLSFAA